MKGAHWLVVAAAVSSASLAASSSQAQVDPTPDRVGPSVGLLLGYGFADGYHLGLTARGGYTLDQPKIYIGGTFAYHFGQDSEHLLYLGPEVGYDLVIPSAPQILIRPYLGLGFMDVSASSGDIIINGVNEGSVSASESGFAFWPGVTGLYSFTPNWSAGLDARVVVPTFGDGGTSFALALAGQYKF
jgi:hypothetical protein